MIILASASPRRKELLEQIGCTFTCETSAAEELKRASSPEELVRQNALLKARAVAQKHGPLDLIIGSDTVVALEGEIFGKPKDDADAKRMLLSLSGKKHFVHTGVALIQGEKEKTFVSSTAVYLAKLTKDDINFYVDSQEPRDKAGAYAIQGIGARFIEKIAGDYNTVVGLPLHKLCQAASELGIKI